MKTQMNANIMKPKIFSFNIRYDLKGPFFVMKRFCDF